MYIQIKSTAESGWDFSSRWFITTNGTNNGKRTITPCKQNAQFKKIYIITGNLSDTQTPNIIPVDLNSLLHLNALTLSTWFNQMGNKNKANEYKNIADELLKSIQEVRKLFLNIILILKFEQ